MATTTEQTVLTFDGEDDAIDCGTGIDLANQSFTIECWVKRAAAGGTHYLVAQGEGSTNNGLHVGFRSSNHFTFAFWGNNLDTASTYTDSDWHHWSCVYDAENKQQIIYRDGEEAAITPAGEEASAYTGTGNFYIGLRNFSGTYYFQGQLVELRIWARALAQSEIQTNMNAALTGTETDLMACWPLNEGEGTTVADKTGNGNTGTIAGDAVWEQAEVVLLNHLLTLSSGEITASLGEVTFSEPPVSSGESISLNEVTFSEPTISLGGTIASSEELSLPPDVVVPSEPIPKSETTASSGSLQTVLTFDGEDDSIDCGLGIDLADKSFTIEFWAQLAPLESGHPTMLCVWQGTNADNQGLHIGFRSWDSSHGTRFTFAFWGNDLDVDSAYVDAEWHHWSCVYNAETDKRTVYRDGEKANEQSDIAPYKGAGEFYIGARTPNNSDFFDGQIADVRVWHTARSQGEIQSTLLYRLTGEEADLVAYWPLNEGEGDSVKDKSGNGNDGTLSSGDFWEPTTLLLFDPQLRLQLLLPSLLFDGAWDYGDCGSGIDLSATSFTIEFYGKREEGGKNQMFLNQGQGSGSGGLSIGFRDSDAFTFSFGGQELNTETTYTDLCWHRWSCVYDATSQQRIIYRNGEEVARDSHSGAAPATGTFYLGFGIGGTASGDVAMDWFLDGKLVDLRIWKRALSPAEIEAGVNYALTGQEPDLVAYWPLNEGEGSTVTDKTGNGHDGTLHNVGWALLTRSPGTGLADYGYWYRWKLNIPVQTGSSSFRRGRIWA